MCDHVKPIVGDLNTDNIILHVGNNDLNSDKTTSQITRPVFDLERLLKTNTNTITISLILPQNDHLNNKAREVNNCLVNMCGERHSLK